MWCLFGFPGQVLVIGTATVSGLLLVEMHDESGGNYVPDLLSPFLSLCFKFSEYWGPCSSLGKLEI